VKAVRDNVQSGQLLTLSLVAGRLSRLTGIEFQDRGRINTANAPGGILDVDGSNTNGNILNTITYTNSGGYEHQVCRSARVISFEIRKVITPWINRAEHSVV
jgi:hypothetical protein